MSELVAIVALSENRVIGRAGALPWRLPADLAHFKRLSIGKPNIMGRKVWASLGGQALPGRQNIVLSRQPDFRAQDASVAHSPEEALELAAGAPEIVIIGGEQIYWLYLPLLSRVEQTTVHARIEGDTFFPPLPGTWEVVSERRREADERNPFDLTFQTLRRLG